MNKYCLPEEFETENYCLRRVQTKDAAAIFDAYAADAAVTKYLAWKPHESVSDTSAFLEAIYANWDQGKSYPVVVFHRKEPEDLLGMFDARPSESCVNYGYVLRASAWGNGCASEVMRWMVEHALSHPMIFRAEAYCDIANPASARVMENAGMTREGILRRYLVHPNISDDPRDCFVYSRVR
ncbi:alanine acetyltransferase [Salipiger aestuarii]|uniref:GNAT family N-acetyltransferase n=1 Tax=Salipiger aestuarii TaxID=568098 RepID=UPI00124D1792|nr:GNAT family protein [Salipiger aestuarii]KAB2531303.1 alanine acetyltransferase [Salipiger aestuarii]